MLITQKLIELSEKSFQVLIKYPKKRFLFNTLKAEINSRTITFLSGPRGVGKSILLKQVLQENENIFYITIDEIEEDVSLYDLAEELEKKFKIKYLILDEIRFNKDYSKEFKKIYDFLEIKLFVTSSVALSLQESSADLSRRAKVFHLYPFSFREYIYFEKDILLAPLSMQNFLDKNWTFEYLKHYSLFKSYLQGRLFPFTLAESNYGELFKSMLHKIVHHDIAQVSDFGFEQLKLINKIIAFVAKAGTDGVSYRSISQNIGVTIYKAQEYIGYLEQAYVLQVILPAGKNVNKEPKILMQLPYRHLYCEWENCLGAIREDFVAMTLRSSGFASINYLKNTRGEKVPDFLVENGLGEEMIFEVGGKGKGTNQFKGIADIKKYILSDTQDWKDYQHPLFMLGMIY